MDHFHDTMMRAGPRVVENYDDDFDQAMESMDGCDTTPLTSTSLGQRSDLECFDDDLDIPDNENLQLIPQKEATFDSEWTRSSLRRAPRSSSDTMFSPTLSSVVTDSEDEGFGCLVLPDGPLKFGETLEKRLKEPFGDTEAVAVPQLAAHEVSAEDDFSQGLDFGDDILDSSRAINRNIKHKPQPTRIPKPVARLEPVAERTTLSSFSQRVSRQPGVTMPSLPGASRATAASTRTTARNISQSTASSSATFRELSMVPSSGIPMVATPGRRGLMSRASAQNLKSKRSMPLLGNYHAPSPARNPSALPRPPSRTDKIPKPSNASRSAILAERPESSLAHARRQAVPFLPAGTMNAQSYHISLLRKEANIEAPLTVSKVAIPKRATNLVQPLRVREFGQGDELDVFDDLPTSAVQESKHMKQPLTPSKPNLHQLYRREAVQTYPLEGPEGFGGATARESKHIKQASIRSVKSYSSWNSNPTPINDGQAPALRRTNDTGVPSWARSTAASRIARESRAGSLNPQPNRLPSSVPAERAFHNPVDWKARIQAKSTIPPRPSKRPAKAARKPFLIKQDPDLKVHERAQDGMYYNARTLRWEGNENALSQFEVSPTPKAANATTGSKPGLIAYRGAVSGLQASGDMVFDERRLTWVKAAVSEKQEKSEAAICTFTLDDEADDDPFAGIDDLEDETKTKAVATGVREYGSDDEFAIGEEFDVGPDFERRQRIEEEKWGKKLQGFVAFLRAPENIASSRNDIRAVLKA